MRELCQVRELCLLVVQVRELKSLVVQMRKLRSLEVQVRDYKLYVAQDQTRLLSKLERQAFLQSKGRLYSSLEVWFRVCCGRTSLYYLSSCK